MASPSVPFRNFSLPAGASLPASVGDWTGGEWTVVILGSVVSFVDVGAVAWLVLNRRVRYIKVLSVELVVLFTLACFCYWLSLLTSTRIIPESGAFLACVWWNQFLAFPLGAALALTVLITRLWKLHVILLQHKPLTWTRMLWFPLVVWFPSLAVSVVSAGVAGDGPVNIDLGGSLALVCLSEDVFTYLNAAVLIVLAIVFVTLAAMLKRVRHRIYQEYTQSIAMFVVLVVTVAVILAILFTHDQFLPWGRVTISFLGLVAINACIWLVIGRPLFNVIFRHAASKAEFELAIANKFVFNNTLSTGTPAHTGSAIPCCGRTSARNVSPPASSGPQAAAAKAHSQSTDTPVSLGEVERAAMAMNDPSTFIMSERIEEDTTAE